MKKVLIVLPVLLLLFINLCFANPINLEASSVMVKNPKLNVKNINEKSSVISMELDNKSNQPVTLVAANSPVASETQLHKTMDGKIVQVNNIQIKPHGDLQSNDFHVVLMGIKSPLKAGHVVPLTLVFVDGSSLSIEVRIENA